MSFKKILLLFLGWRTGLFLLGILGFSLLPFKASFPYIDEQLVSSGFPQAVWQWGNFDGVHYLDIAKNGYHGSGLQVFFPLYPLLIKLGWLLTSNYFFTALFISDSFFFLSLIVFYRLCKKHFSEETAWWATLFLLFFPTSFFFGSIYSESLFLFLVLGSFWFLGAGRLVGSAILGALSGMTRIVGAFAFGGIFGFLSYAAYLWWGFGNPLYFLSAQAAFRNERAYSLTALVTPPQVVFRYLKIFTTVDPFQPAFQVAILEFGFFIFGVVILFWLTIKRKVPLSWLIFSWLALMVPSFSGTFSSMPRYVLTIFPIYIALALIKRSAVKIAVLTLFILLLGYLTILFTRGYWVA